MDHPGWQSGRSNKNGVISGHQASHDLGVAKLKCAPGADSQHYATEHTHHFNGHFPGEPGLDGWPFDNKEC